VVYDPTTGARRIQHRDDVTEFAADSGAHFLGVLKDLAEDSAASQNPSPADMQLLRDWQTIVRWLGAEGRPLTADDYAKFGRAFHPFAVRVLGFPSSSRTATTHNRQHPDESSLGSTPAELFPIFARTFANPDQLQRAMKTAAPFVLPEPNHVGSRPTGEPHSARVSTNPPAAQTTMRISPFPLIASMLMLGTTLINPESVDDNGFFRLLRLVVCTTAIYGAWNASKHPA
jgi:hypothetical protein